MYHKTKSDETRTHKVFHNFFLSSLDITLFGFQNGIQKWKLTSNINDNVQS